MTMVTCPSCKSELVWDTSNRYRPFCSPRCKLIDLGKWANEEFVISRNEKTSIDNLSEEEIEALIAQMEQANR